MRDSGPQSEAHESYLEILRRNAPIVVISAIVIAGIAYAVSLTQSKQYEASADVFVASNGLQSSVGDTPILSTDPDRVLATQAQVARTPQVADIAAKSADVSGVTPESLLGDSTVTPGAGEDILTFSVTSSEPESAETLANSYADAYIAYRHRLDTKTTVQARKQVDRKIEELKAQGGPQAKAIPELTNKSERLGTQAVLGGDNATLGQPATSAAQIQPRPVRNAFLGGILGILLGIGLVFLRDALNTRVRSTSEVEERLGIPLIGRIPPPPKKLSDANLLSVVEEPHTPQSESYRMLATNIELVNLERGASSIMICSPVHSEGKSTTAANLAVAFARRGQRVALMEADLRRPTMRKLFHLEDGPGIVDVAIGRVSLDEALTSVDIPADETISGNGTGTASGSLEVLAGGPMPPSPAEFMKSRPVADIVARLSERSDLLLIDTPPLLHVSDALTLMLNADIDCAIIAARLGTVRRQALAEARRILDTAPVVKLGFFTTGAPSRGGYGGAYGYYQEYHYGERATQPSKG
jgi:succinoglycan biosynthesis transport protein ExoP